MAEGQETIVLLAVALIGLGFANCFYGYRIFRLTLSLVGLLAGLALGISSFSSSDGTVTFMGIFVGIILGLAGAGIVRRFYFIAIFLGGAIFGLVLVGAILAGVGIDPHLVAMLVGAGVGGMIALFINKIMITLSTAFGGAAAILGGIGRLLFDEAPEGVVIPVLFLMGWVILGLVGAAVQFKAGGARSRPDHEKHRTEPQQP